jgi:hypothetical protein
VRRRRSIEERSSSEGTHRKGADDGDARTESAAEEGLRWREAGEADAWAVGDECATLGQGGRDERHEGEKNSADGRWLHFKGERWGGGPRRGGCHVEAEWERERGARARWGQRRGVASGGPAAARTGGSIARATVKGGGSGRCGTAWLTGGPGRDGGPIVSGWVRRGAAW